jgi:hypothetical protein
LANADLSAVRVRGTIYDEIRVGQLGLLTFGDIDADNLYVPMHGQTPPPDRDPVVELGNVEFVKANQMIFEHLVPASAAPQTDGFEECYSLTAHQSQLLHFMHVDGPSVDPAWPDHFGLTANVDHAPVSECDVDVADFAKLASELAASSPGSPAADRCDLDVDGDVDLDDYGLLAMQMCGPTGGFAPAVPPGGGEQAGGGDGGGEPLGGEQTGSSGEQAVPPADPIDWEQATAEAIEFFSDPASAPESDRPAILEAFRDGAETDPNPDRAAYQTAIANALEELWGL